MGDKEQLAATKELVRLTQGAFVSNQQIMHLIGLFFPQGAGDLDVAIYILHQIVELVRSLPGKFFKDDQSQAQFLTTAQAKLDALILEEEEAAGEAMLMEGNG
jgi:hypothetical protein